MRKETKPYQTRRDMQWKGSAWFTGNVRRLTIEEAQSLLEQGLIYVAEPKRFVMLDGKEMTWGGYLKRKRHNKSEITE